MALTVVQAGVGGTGTTSFPAPGSSGNVLTSNGSAWTSSTPPASNSINQSLPLKSGTSLTAGRCVSLNSSGEVGEYPVINTFGTEYTNAVTTAYSTFSTDGSRVIKVTVSTSPIYAATWTISGGAVSSSGVVTNGGTTVTVTNTNGDQGSGNWSTAAQFFATSATEFFGVFYQGTFNGGNGSKIAMFTVDGSGNVTKSSETTVLSGNTDTQSVYSPSIARMGNVFLCRWSGNNIYRTYTVSGTSYTNATDADVNSYGGNGVLTSNNIASFAEGTTSYRGAYTTNNFASPTTSTVISDLFNGASVFWKPISATRFIAVYKNTSSQVIARTFSVNQADGVLSSVSTFVLKADASITTFESISFTVKSNTELVYAYTDASIAYINSMSLDSSGNILGINTPLENTSFSITPVYTSSNTFFAYYYNSAPKIKTYTVNAYLTTAFNIVGVATATTSSSPTTITVGGIADGFSGLTPGVIYYVDSTAYNGTVTTSSLSGVRVGKAISTSQILLGQL
jgi:hypothetical protein